MDGTMWEGRAESRRRTRERGSKREEERYQGSDAGEMFKGKGKGEEGGAERESHCGSSTIWQVMKHFVM